MSKRFISAIAGSAMVVFAFAACMAYAQNVPEPGAPDTAPVERFDEQGDPSIRFIAGEDLLTEERFKALQENPGEDFFQLQSSFASMNEGGSAKGGQREGGGKGEGGAVGSTSKEEVLNIIRKNAESDGSGNSGSGGDAASGSGGGKKKFAFRGAASGYNGTASLQKTKPGDNGKGKETNSGNSANDKAMFKKMQEAWEKGIKVTKPNGKDMSECAKGAAAFVYPGQPHIYVCDSALKMPKDEMNQILVHETTHVCGNKNECRATDIEQKAMRKVGVTPIANGYAAGCGLTAGTKNADGASGRGGAGGGGGGGTARGGGGSSGGGGAAGGW
ncbi:MAG: M35 family metallo-endopeptidase [Elusimicrobiales bacterium]|nr:M35 family metallo-endopeptidase [Elusimicrobiales bacterium]